MALSTINSRSIAAGALRDSDLGTLGSLTVDGNVSIDGGTIKLDGNYPTGTNNVALGDTALDSLTSGSTNTAIGHIALTANADGNSNTAIGGYTLAQNTSG